MSSQQEQANRANAQLSTGPRTEEGKAKSSLNALKTGLTGSTVLLPSEDAERYLEHLRAFEEQYQPSSGHERHLLESIAGVAWRLARIPTLEMAIFAKGRTEFAGLVSEQEAALRPALTDAHTCIAYEKHLRNLHLQEARLARRQEKEIAAFYTLRKERAAEKAETLETATALYLASKLDSKPFDPANFGFEFSIADLEAQKYLKRARDLARRYPSGHYRGGEALRYLEPQAA